MSAATELLHEAFWHGRTGNPRRAAEICDQLLQAGVPDAEAWHMLGVLAFQLGRNAAAYRCLCRAIELQPDFADAHGNLGIVLQERGQLTAAIDSWQQALRLRPDIPEVHSNLGLAFLQQGQLGAAEAHLHAALQLRPDFADAHHHLGSVRKKQERLAEAVAFYRRAHELHPHDAGKCLSLAVALREHGQLDEAAAWFRHAITLQPNFAEAEIGLGLVLMDRGRLDEADAHLQTAVRVRPDIPDSHLNLGLLRHKQRRLEEAVECYRAALRLKPDYAEAHNNLGLVEQDLEHHDAAIASFRRAIELKADVAQVHYNLGISLFEQRQFDAGIAEYHEALRLRPGYPEPHYNLGLQWLLLGNFEQGWPEYEWRWHVNGLTQPRYAQPTWDGSPVPGETILLHAEQGFGDTLQFIRYAPLVRERAARVLFAAPAPLLRLLRGCPGIDQLVPQTDPFPEVDLHAELLSLPLLFRTTLATVPSQVPYLFAEPGQIETWRQRLSALLRSPASDLQRQASSLKPLAIGIAWQGNPIYRADKRRSIPLEQFAPLAAVPGVQLFSLQKGHGTEQLAAVADRFAVTDLGSTLDDGTGAFVETAAVMKNLHLVVTSDTAIAHLAGCLGVPVWLALPHSPDWRWLLDRPDCPWYPTMRLFRQREPGNWPEVFERMAGLLHKGGHPA